ncbi:hypothetical protein V495_06608 [Pseudogymnoascus sp. VKM F-4514 (FW-929)]|nr:hypothetical protein V495_06608 [Pseudogymnoascus sp. VKM F-4514 (FW-929)]KFY52495.1 hypothetical protein V497_08513 [Pseudogymnoascus sp. VKM F-4516 (FW-969)]
MSFRRFFWFCYAVTTLYVTVFIFLESFARAPPTHALSEDTPIDQIVSCVYPMSGQYELLPRILFYASLVFASTMRGSGWFANIFLGLAMSYSTTAFVHIVVIYATHGWKPPILDLDVYGIFLVSTAGASMYPALIGLRQSGWKGRAVHDVIGYWWCIMFLLSGLATVLMTSVINDPRLSSNSAAACYLPDDTLLTSLAQLNGTRDLECIYDCFFTRKSVLKAQDAVTVVWAVPTNSQLDWGTTIGLYCYSVLFAFGDDMLKYPRMLKALGAWMPRPEDTVYNQDKGALMAPSVYLCLIHMLPWVITMEVSLRSLPFEEESFAIGQWGPCVAAVVAIIGGGIYHVLKRLEKNNEEVWEPILYGQGVDSPANYMMSGALAERGDNIPMDHLLGSGRRDDAAASRRSDDTYRTAPEGHIPQENSAVDGQVTGQEARDTPGENRVAHLLDDEIDIGTHTITPEVER